MLPIFFPVAVIGSDQNNRFPFIACEMYFHHSNTLKKREIKSTNALNIFLMMTKINKKRLPQAGVA